jgi:hypothetical protein
LLELSSLRNPWEEIEQEHLAAFRQAAPSVEKTYQLVQDFLVMMRQREGERLDAWLTQVQESGLPERKPFLRRAWSGINPLYKPD